MINFLKHVYYAVRYGEWKCGWEDYLGKPKFLVDHIYYDGNHVVFHCYKLWIEVYY